MSCRASLWASCLKFTRARKQVHADVFQGLPTNSCRARDVLSHFTLTISWVMVAVAILLVAVDTHKLLLTRLRQGCVFFAGRC